MTTEKRKRAAVEYVPPKDLSWALGCCDDCKFGLLSPPPIPKEALSTLQARRVQARQGLLNFCDCRAGKAQQHELLQDAAPPPPPTPTIHH